MGQHALNNQLAEPDADADGDGISNFAEFVFGSDPGEQNGPPHFEPKTVNNYFTLRYLRRSGGTEDGAVYTTPDATYAPQASLDLATWNQPIIHVAPPGGLPSPPSGYEWGAVRIASPMSNGGKGFVRLAVMTP